MSENVKHTPGSGTIEELYQKLTDQGKYNDHLIATKNKIEAERVRLWNENRDLRASLDVEKAATDSIRIERDLVRAALESIASPNDCGCSPVCQCNSQEGLEIQLDAMRDTARAAIAAITKAGG